MSFSKLITSKVQRRPLLLVMSITSAALLCTSWSTQAGIEFEDDVTGTKVNLGGRLQVLTLFNDDDFKPDESVEFRVRRARLRLGITANEYMSMFLQTEFADDPGGAGGDTRLIDAFLTLKANSWVQLVSGLNMSPASRQNLTSSAASMTFDRPGVTNYSLTWGLKGNAGLQTGTVPGTQVGVFGDNQVRDLGMTLFGSGSFSDQFHMKYYAGVYEGSIHSDDTLRYTGRIQLNFGDAEPGYYNSSTYLSKKSTIGLGLSVDSQEDFAREFSSTGQADYLYTSLDAFWEQGFGAGALTLEASYAELDISGGETGLADQDGTALRLGTSARQAEGSGGYLQAGYFINNWQPFALYEQWDADASGGVGSWEAVRAGVGYYFSGQRSNVKLAVENIDLDEPGAEDILTVAVGFYTNF